MDATKHNEGWADWKVDPDIEVKGQFWCAGDPCLLKEGDQYRMYYTGVNPPAGQPVCTIIGQMTSKDAKTWQFAPPDGEVKGIALKGEPNTWCCGVETCFVRKQAGEYWMYFVGYANCEGWNKGPVPCQLGLATSTDGNEFKMMRDKPILEVTKDGYDSGGITSPSIVEHNGILHMVYTGICGDNCTDGPKIRLLGATSTDGIHWTKREAPVFEATPGYDWMNGGVAEAEVSKGPDGKFYLFFTGFNDGKYKHVIGLAQSDTPFGPWEICPEPIAEPTGRAGRFDEDKIIAPGVLYDGDTVRMWFHGFAKDGSISTGYAACKWPLRKEAAQKKEQE